MAPNSFLSWGRVISPLPAAPRGCEALGRNCLWCYLASRREEVWENWMVWCLLLKEGTCCSLFCIAVTLEIINCCLHSWLLSDPQVREQKPGWTGREDDGALGLEIAARCPLPSLGDEGGSCTSWVPVPSFPLTLSCSLRSWYPLPQLPHL